MNANLFTISLFLCFFICSGFLFLSLTRHTALFVDRRTFPVPKGLTNKREVGLLRWLHHLQGGGGEGVAHEGEGLGAPQVVVAGVRCPALEHRGFFRRDQLAFVIPEILADLRVGHLTVTVGKAFVLGP